MYINDELIKQLANREIQVKTPMTAASEVKLRVVLALAFPEDMEPGNNYRFYHAWKQYPGKYTYTKKAVKDIPVVELEEFFKLKRFTINLNDTIEVELTRYGLTVFREYALEKSSGQFENYKSEEVCKAVFSTYSQNIVGNKFIGQMHLFMDVFGFYIKTNTGTEFDVIVNFNVVIDRSNTSF